MRGGQDRLVKEIDALTYNARSTLNALIRSAVVSGTNNGYTVTRAGIDISLDRVDIYRLYKFYQEWEDSSFDSDLFDSILSDQNSTTVIDDNGTEITTATTDALVKHSKILYMNSDNSDMTDNSDYWLGLVKTAVNKKLVSNTAPIPLNLRTPVFDENLSTAKYDQYETFLFPFSYFTADLLGYSGDDIAHSLNGDSWDIVADSYFNVQSDAIAFGGVNEFDLFKTKARRNHDVDNDGNAYTITYSLTSGYDTQARAKYSSAGGLSSLVPRGAVGGIAEGYRELASDSYAAAIGGFANKAVNVGSGVFGGSSNFSAGMYSGIIGGVSCFTGDSSDVFIFPGSDASSSTCIVLNEDECESISNGSTVGRSLIAVSGNKTDKYNIGDTVLLHTFTCYSDTGSYKNYWELNGDAYQSQTLLITSVQYLDPESYPDNINKGYTLLTLSGDVVGSGKVDGGYVSRIKDSSGNYLGYASVAMNYHTIALGSYQTVVGKYNSPLQDALFIVGNGDGTGDYIKSNVMVVRSDGASIYGSPNNDYLSAYIDFTVNYVGISGVVEDSGFNVTSTDNSFYSSSYIGLFTSNNNDDYNVLLRSDDKPLILRSGIDTTYSYTPTDMDIAILSDNDIILASNANTFINSDGYVLINSDSDDLILSWDKNLQLIGDTFGALATTDDQFSHIVDGNDVTAFTESGVVSTIHGIMRSGFYDVRNYTYESVMPDDDTIIGDGYNTLRILNLGDKTSDNKYNAWKLIFPVLQDSTDSLSHIKVMFNELKENGSETTISKARSAKYLAYLDDLDDFNDYGVWHTYDADTDSTEFISSIYFQNSNSKVCTITDLKYINSIITLFKITSIGNTMIMQFVIDITNLINGESYGSDELVADASTSKIINFTMNSKSNFWINNGFENLITDGTVCSKSGSWNYTNNQALPDLVATFSTLNIDIISVFGTYTKKTDSVGIKINAGPYGLGVNTSQRKYVFTLIGELEN